MLVLFNTLTRRKEEFVPLEAGKAKIYSCGITTNNFAHIGHGVAYIMMDLLVKTLKLNGYNVFNVMNITDVGHLTSDEDEGDDKVAAAAKREGKDAYAIAKFYGDYFFEFIKRLNIDTPSVVCKATEHIDEMIKFVKGLQEKGFTYKTSDGIYYDVAKFKDYGKLSGKKLNDLKAGARIEVNSEKRSPHDFALWKNVGENALMKWHSPFGQWGCPGWHIECSAMSHKYLGERYDIHTGGADHISIHHENEIAQSEGLYGFKTVNYWLHCEFLKIDGGKMSKSLGNCYTLEDLEKRGYSPLDFRYLCLNSSYRKPLNFTWEALSGARTSLKRLYEVAAEHMRGNAKISPDEKTKLKENFLTAINDDLNIAKALGDIWVALKNLPKSREVFDFLILADSVLGLNIKENVAELKPARAVQIPQEILKLAQQRQQAKQVKDFALADVLRKQIEHLGYKITDTTNGFDLRQN